MQDQASQPAGKICNTTTNGIISIPLPARELIANPLDSIVVDMMRMIFNVLVELIEKLCHSIYLLWQPDHVYNRMKMSSAGEKSKRSFYSSGETLNSPSLLLNSLLTRIRAFLVPLITITLSPFLLFEILVI